MDIGTGIRSPGGVGEDNQQQALLAWATARIDELANQRGDKPQLGETLDWLAYFTREYFGFQQRMLTECSQHREYLFSRMAVHCEFRRRLAQLCVDMVRRDPTVPERLSGLCHDLLADAQAHDKMLSEILRNGEAAPRLRKKPRRGEPAAMASRVFESATDDPAPRMH